MAWGSANGRQIIQIASRLQVGTEINYTGIDLFEARDPSQGPGLALRQAHRLLAQTGARIRLAPGDAFTGVAQVANALAGTDLIVISGCQDRELVDRAWFYFPRMSHQHTAVFLQNPCQTGQSAPYERILPAEIEALAARKRHLRGVEQAPIRGPADAPPAPGRIAARTPTRPLAS